jgi:hypothetical protein
MSTLKTITLFDEEEDWPEDLIGLIAWLQEHLNSIPEKYRATAKFRITPGGEWNGATVDIQYKRPENEEDRRKRDEQERALAQALRQNQINKMHDLMARYPNEAKKALKP